MMAVPRCSKHHIDMTLRGIYGYCCKEDHPLHGELIVVNIHTGTSEVVEDRLAALNLAGIRGVESSIVDAAYQGYVVDCGPHLWLRLPQERDKH